jgi:hypothetical protein
MKNSTRALSSPECNPICIGHSEVGEVAICPDCGVVHVRLQYMSMRFELSAFRTLSHMLAGAQARIEHVTGARHEAALNRSSEQHGGENIH